MKSLCCFDCLTPRFTANFTSYTHTVKSLDNKMATFVEEEKTAKLIDGKAIAQTIRGELKEKVDAMKEKYGKVPGLAVVLVGDRKDSATYVRMKKKACKEVCEKLPCLLSIHIYTLNSL